MNPLPSRVPNAADDVFTDYAMRVESGESVDFEALCAAHPALAAELRGLHARYRAQKDIRRAAGLGTLPPVTSASIEQARTILDGIRARGATLDRYRIVEKIGEGGMGTVYEAEDELLGRRVALKVISDKSRATEFLPLFDREMRIAARLTHPGVGGAFDAGVDEDGRVFFTMPLVRGRDLSEILELVRHGTGGWTVTRALGVLRQVCATMAYVHSRGVVHRDLKPSNIRVGEFGEVLVLDWGLAKDVSGRDEAEGNSESVASDQFELGSLSRTGTGRGTPAYMSPEQAGVGDAPIGPATDVYAVGAMLYEILVGQPPYSVEGERAQGAKLIEQIRKGPPRPLESFAQRRPSELVQITEKAMARQVRDRYPNLEAVAADLSAYLENRPTTFEPGTWAETKKWVKRNKLLAASLAAVLLVSTGGAVAFRNKAGEAERNERTALTNATRAEQGERAAKVNAAEARRNAEQAEANAIAAQLARDEATQKANDVLSLSAQKDHDDLVADAAKLWPAHPEMIPAYEDWLRRANELIDGRPADESKGLKKRPSLAEHKAKLAELRRGAKPLSEAEIQAERESHPRYAELKAKQAELLWRSRMLGDEAWLSDTSIEAELAQESLPTDAEALNELAWPLVDPAEPIFGQEVRALLLARRAVAAASDEKRAGIRDTLSWALFKLGRFDEALDEERTALSEPGGDALKSSAADLEKAVAAWRGEELAKRREERDALAAEIATLTSDVNERRTYEFDDPEKEWWNRQLVKLVSDLENFRDPATGLMSEALAEPFGWGVAKRYEFAKSIGERSVDSPEAKLLWSEAIAAIKASPKYGGLEIVPQMGLLPIGMDPNSQLWEFAHLQTGEAAGRGADGKLVLTEEFGLVFVLIPGGTFWMGAQSLRKDGENYDPKGRDNEGPVHEVSVSPFLISKFEMTQGQWERLTGANPSYYHPGTSDTGHKHDLIHPVEQVTWWECMQCMERLKLSLPSEAQWEYACRAGRQTPWWTGEVRESLIGTLNIADQTAKRARAPWSEVDDWPDLEDGFVVHAPVGSFTANPFGLHDVYGNLWEWCIDGAEDYAADPQVDPVVAWSENSLRMLRGGSFYNDVGFARSAIRDAVVPEFQAIAIGLRPTLVPRLSTALAGK